MGINLNALSAVQETASKVMAKMFDNQTFVILFTVFLAILVVVLGVMICLIIKERRQKRATTDNVVDDSIEVNAKLGNKAKRDKIIIVDKSEQTKCYSSISTMPIILASKSPRRLELLGKYFDNISVETHNIAEKSDKVIPREMVEDIATQKIAIFAEKYQNRLVVSADTIVVRGNKIYGKPTSEANAMEILKELSGKWHDVITGYCVSFRGRINTYSEVSHVLVKTLTDAEILAYIATGSPMDKAGAYGIQDNVVVERYEGDLDNIIGLPIDKVYNVCRQLINEGN